MKLESNQGIKILLVMNPEEGSLRSCHGGTYEWDSPKLNEDGSSTPPRPLLQRIPPDGPQGHFLVVGL